jgi:6-pyruvoyltetrahydropterin/6-carboxytetrahydropterin synthase
MTTLHTISKDFQFSSSHQLAGLPEEHPCSRLHGHNYTVRLSLSGTLNEVGFVVDYRDLAPFKDYIDNTLDHRHLNDVLEGNPTAERMSVILTHKALGVLDLPPSVNRIKVSVSETPKTWADYETMLHIERNL